MSTSQTNSKFRNTVNAMAALERIRTNPKIVLLISAAAAISLLIALLFWAKSPDYRTLYSNISEQDGGAVVTQLAQMQVPYRFEHGGAIMVPADKVYETRLKLAQQGLPKGGAVGFELLDKEKFGISQFSEQINYQRALEGELARTIEMLGPVQTARVHLAIPKPSLFVRDEKAPTASVTLHLHNGRSLDDSQANAISYLISSAVPALTPDKVTILDQNGQLLSQSGSQAVQTSQRKYISNVETDYQRRIQAILAPVLGAENVRTQVTAQVDFTLHEQTAEQYQPNTNPEKMAIRSRQNNCSEQGGKTGAGGVPGALSNQPSPPAVAAIEKPEAGQKPDQKEQEGRADKERAEKPESLTPYSRDNNETTNYELDRTLTHIKRSTGNIERLSVGVVVNYRIDENGKPVALSEAQLTQIETLVKEAMGFSAERGDTLNVINTLFVTDSSNDGVEFWKEPAFIDFLLSAGRYLLIVLVAWVLWRKLVRPAWLRQQEFLRERLELEKQIREVELNARRTEQESLNEARAQQRMDTELSTQKLRDLAEHEPQLIAFVIRQWMNGEAKP